MQSQNRKRIKNIIVEKFSKIASNQLFVGIVLGAISSIIINLLTFQYENFQTQQKYRKSLIQEIEFNLAKIDSQTNDGLVYVAQFQTEAWDSGISSGEIYSFDTESILKVQNLYGVVKRMNQVRAISENEQWKIFYESAKYLGIAQYYDDEIEKGNLSNEKINDYTAKKDAAVEASDALFVSVDESRNLFINDNSTTNSELRSKLIDTRELLNKPSRQSNSLYFVSGLLLLLLILLVIYAVVRIYFASRKKKIS